MIMLIDMVADPVCRILQKHMTREKAPSGHNSAVRHHQRYSMYVCMYIHTYTCMLWAISLSCFFSLHLALRLLIVFLAPHTRALIFFFFLLKEARINLVSLGTTCYEAIRDMIW